MKKEESNQSVFEVLNAINVNDKTDKKGNLTYLSWAFAWSEVKKLFPSMTRKVYERESGLNYFDDARTCWVKVGVTINELEYIDYLPIMDFRNQSITAENVTSFDVNKAIQRATTKALALHGLGLYIYAGEDLPEEDKKVQQEARKQASKESQKKKLTPELFKRALKSIVDGNYTEEELREMFVLNKTQETELKKSLKKDSSEVKEESKS
jgi:hypothetical protein